MRIAFQITLLALAASAPAQIPGMRQGSQFPFLSVDARAASLGDAVVGWQSGFSAFQANPAAMSFLDGSSVQYTFHRIVDGYSLERLGAVFQSGETEGWGVHIDLLHFGDLHFYTDPDVRGNGFELGGGLSYGRRICRDLGAGITLRILSATTDTRTVWALVGDFGLSYSAGRYYQFGLSLRGLGTDYDVPKSVVPTGTYSAILPRSLALGVVFSYPFARYSQRLLLAFENDKLLGQSGILYKVGVEYIPVSVLGFRGGVVIRQNEIQPRAGVGVSTGGFMIDYAYLYSRQDGHPSHLITLGIRWR